MAYTAQLESTQQMRHKPRIVNKRAETLARLRELGLTEGEMMRSEANNIFRHLGVSEQLGAVVCGHSKVGHIMIAATDSRVIVFDVKPLFTNSEDISYDVVAGISVTNVGPFSSVSLFTRLGDFKLLTKNVRAANNFKSYVDRRCIRHPEDVQRSRIEGNYG